MGRFPEKTRVFSLGDMIYLEIPRAVPQNIGLKRGLNTKTILGNRKIVDFPPCAKYTCLRSQGGTL